MSKDEAMAIIMAAVADCLGVEVDAIQAQSRLITELDADSLDLVDLMFTLEKRFDIQLGQARVESLFRLETDSGDFGPADHLTVATVARLQRYVPELAARGSAKVTPAEILPLFTVETLWRFVDEQLRTADTAATSS